MPTINGKACVANGRNLIVQSELKAGYLDGYDGGPRDSKGDFYSDNFIATNGETIFTFSSPDYVFKGSTSNNLAMYDSDKNYLGYQPITSATQKLVKSNVSYIRFSINFINEGGTTVELSDWLANHRYKLEKGSVATPLAPAPVDKVFSNGRQVYGRNLLKGTFTSSFPNGANGKGTTISLIDGDDGEKYLHVVSALNGGGMYMGAYQLSSIMLPFKKYTVSADIKGDGAISFGFEHAKSPVATLTSDWKRYSVSYEFGDRTESIIWYGIANFYIRLVKLEEGTIATPWTPAPEDVM